MKEKKDGTQAVGAAKGGRRPTDAAPTGRAERGRFSSARKMEAVLRLFRGEALDTLSRELGVAASTLAGWKEAFLGAGQAGLKSREPDPQQEENARLKTIVGDLTLRLEIHRQAERLRGVAIVTGSLLAFAVPIGRLAIRHPWTAIAREFDPRTGNYLLFGLIPWAAFPWLVMALRG